MVVFYDPKACDSRQIYKTGIEIPKPKNEGHQSGPVGPKTVQDAHLELGQKLNLIDRFPGGHHEFWKNGRFLG